MSSSLDYGLKHNILVFFGFLVPTLIVLAPFFSGYSGPIVPLFIYLLIPIIFVLNSERGDINFLYVLIVSFFLLLQSIYLVSGNFEDVLRAVILVLLSFIFFNLGLKGYFNKNFYMAFKGIYLGVFFVNVISFLLFIGILLDFVDPLNIYSIFGRENELGFFALGWRFSLGNAIQVPFFLTTILVGACIYLIKDRKISLFPITLNLINALISQSRVVILIALLLFLYVALRNKNYLFLLLFSVIVMSVVISYWEFLNELVFGSLFDRFSGNDYGSFGDRAEIFLLFWENASWTEILFGAGATSSSIFMSYEYTFASTVEPFVNRSPESMFLQLVFEQGIFLVLIMIFFSLDKNILSFRNLIKFNPLLWLIFLEQFFLLQITEYSFIVLFVIGLLISSKNDTKKLYA